MLRDRGLRGKRRGITTIRLLIVVAVLLLVVSCVALLSRRQAEVSDESPASAPARGASAGNVAADAALPELATKPSPISPGFRGCPAEGDGGDPALNRLKNRVDSAAWMPVSLEAVLALPWPARTEQRARRAWSPAEAAAVSRYEGLPLAVEGVIVGAKQEGPESPNCHGADARLRDWHVWLAHTVGETRSTAIVIEITPPVRATHSGWTLSRLRRLARDGTPVRVSGWLMLDPEHPDQVGRTRGTIWELHPVMAIDVKRGRTWVPFGAPPRHSPRRGR